MTIFKIQKNSGFTLIEIIVSMALFVVVAVVSLGALLKVIDANTKAQTLKTAVTNLNFTMESMVRELRVGSNYYCIEATEEFQTLGISPFTETTLSSPLGCDLTGGAWVLAFNSSKVYPDVNPTCNLIYAYYFSLFSLYKGEQSTCGEQLQFYPLIYGSIDPLSETDSNIGDTLIEFGATRLKVVTGTGNQPYVRLRLRGTTGSTGGRGLRTASAFDIQATASQRIMD